MADSIRPVVERNKTELSVCCAAAPRVVKDSDRIIFFSGENGSGKISAAEDFRRKVASMLQRRPLSSFRRKSSKHSSARQHRTARPERTAELTVQLGLSVEGADRELFVDLLAERFVADKFDAAHVGPDAALNAYALPTEIPKQETPDGYLLTSKYVAAGKRTMTQEEIKKEWDIVAADCAERARKLPDPENLLDPHSAEWANIVREPSFFLR